MAYSNPSMTASLTYRMPRRGISSSKTGRPDFVGRQVSRPSMNAVFFAGVSSLFLFSDINKTRKNFPFPQKSGIDREQEIPGRQKVVRGSNVLVLTSHAGLNPRSKHASLRFTASLAALRAGYECEARVIKNELIFHTKYKIQRKE